MDTEKNKTFIPVQQDFCRVQLMLVLQSNLLYFFHKEANQCL